MATFKGSILDCKICGSAFKVPPSRVHKAEFCSIKCASIGRGKRLQKRVTIECRNCGDPFEAPQCHEDRRKYCSQECKHKHHDYLQSLSERLRRENNPMWKGGEILHSGGYVYLFAPEHPFASNGYVFAHRLAMEWWLRENEPESPFLISLGNQIYLSPDFVVHHKDENKRNNAISNLQCLTNSEHMTLHSEMRKSNRKD